MTRYRVKKTKDGINRSSVNLFGPVNDVGEPLPDPTSQDLDFNQGNGDVAFAELTAGQWYAVHVRLFGDKGADFKVTTKPDGDSGEFKDFFAFKIPPDLAGNPGGLGHSYSSSKLAKVPGA